jgi:hypothetical protein
LTFFAASSSLMKRTKESTPCARGAPTQKPLTGMILSRLWLAPAGAWAFAGKDSPRKKTAATKMDNKYILMAVMIVTKYTNFEPTTLIPPKVQVLTPF